MIDPNGKKTPSELSGPAIDVESSKTARCVSDIIALASAVLAVLVFLVFAVLEYDTNHRANEEFTAVPFNTAYFGR